MQYFKLKLILQVQVFDIVYQIVDLLGINREGERMQNVLILSRLVFQEV